MSITEKLAELNRAQSHALAEFYASTKALERAEERIRSLNQQINVLAPLADEVSDGAAE